MYQRKFIFKSTYSMVSYLCKEKGYIENRIYILMTKRLMIIRRIRTISKDIESYNVSRDPHFTKQIGRKFCKSN
jgi:hypothetical protein